MVRDCMFDEGMPRGGREHADHTAKLAIGGAIPPRLFRPCVLVVTHQRRRFEPAADVVATQPLEARESSV